MRPYSILRRASQALECARHTKAEADHCKKNWEKAVRLGRESDAAFFQRTSLATCALSMSWRKVALKLILSNEMN